MPDRLLMGPAALFAATSAYATAVGAHEPQLPGEPLGLHVPGRVRTHLLLGLGSGVAAPWPMPVAALWAAWRGDPQSGWAARTVAGTGAAVLAGTLVEPVTWGRRPRSGRAALTIPLHLVSGAVMLWAGSRRLREVDPPR